MKPIAVAAIAGLAVGTVAAFAGAAGMFFYLRRSLQASA